MKLLVQIKKAVHTHSIKENFLAFFLLKQKYANPTICQKIIQVKSLSYLKHFFRKWKDFPKSSNKVKGLKNPEKNTNVWFCWLQGLDRAPNLVKKCLSSIKKNMPGMNVNVITEDNVSSFISLPDIIVAKYNKGIISPTNYADIIRFGLLAKYGGFWLDSTVFLTDKVDSSIQSLDLFMFQEGWFCEEAIKAGIWFIYAKKENVIIENTYLRLIYYWTKKNFCKNYFLGGLILSLVISDFPEEWGKIPYFNIIDSHILQYYLYRPFDENEFQRICTLTSIHKLTNKIHNENFKGTFFDKLFM